MRLPGLHSDKLRSGNTRWRVRMAGNPGKWTRLHVDPAHPDFLDHYKAARQGVSLPAPDAREAAPRGSLPWLVNGYLADMEQRVKDGRASIKTLKVRRIYLLPLAERYQRHHAVMRTEDVIRLRDDKAATPGAADALTKSLRALYDWGIDRGWVQSNPAKGVGRLISRKASAGATPWTTADLSQFRARHPAGTKPHLCLTLLLFTGCRIGDAAILGRGHEFQRQGVAGIGWQPTKARAPYTEVPMLPPLYEATRAVSVIGPTYLLTSYGKPYASGDALGQHFRKWCSEAGLKRRSAHGVRKAVGTLLAEHGCSSRQIMAILGHDASATSEVYTKGADRWRLAMEGVRALQGMDW